MFKTRILLLIISLVFSGQLFAKLPVSVQLWSVKDTLKNDFTKWALHEWAAQTKTQSPINGVKHGIVITYL